MRSEGQTNGVRAYWQYANVPKNAFN